MTVAAINGTDIYYETHGDGFPLVFVHGGFGGLGTGQGGATPGWPVPSPPKPPWTKTSGNPSP